MHTMQCTGPINRRHSVSQKILPPVVFWNLFFKQWRF